MPKRVFTALLLLLLLITAAIYFRSVGYGYIRWDDQELVEENPNLHPPTAAHLEEFWRRQYVGLYTPVSYTVWWVVANAAVDEHGALNPGYFHALNLGLHLICVGLVFSILTALLQSMKPDKPVSAWPAFFGALIFAVHPLQVEAVAWISGMNNLLAGALSLLAIRLYIARKGWAYGLATVVFILALLAKPTAVITPLICLVMDLFMGGRPARRVVILTGVWLLMVIPEIYVTRYVQPIRMFQPPVLWVRSIFAMDSFGFYLRKIFIPWNLSIEYARTPARVWEQGLAHWTVPIIVVPGVVLFFFRRKAAWLILAGLIFVAALLPTSGLVAFAFQEFSTTADRYVYLAMLGPAVAVAWVTFRFPKAGVFGAVGGVLLVLCILTIYQVGFWQDTMALTLHALKIDPISTTANTIRGAELASPGQGRPDLAITCYRTALLRSPSNAEIHFNLGNALLATNQLKQAQEEYVKAISRLPGDLAPRALTNLGLVYLKMGDTKRAEGEFDDALAINPRFVPALTNLGLVYWKMGDTKRAEAEFDDALAIDPGYMPALMNLRMIHGQ